MITPYHLTEAINRVHHWKPHFSYNKFPLYPSPVFHGILSLLRVNGVSICIICIMGVS